MPLAVTVRVLPSLDTPLVAVWTTLPPFFRVNSIVWLSTRFATTASQSEFPVTAWSLPSNIAVKPVIVGLPSAPVPVVETLSPSPAAAKTDV